MMRGHSVSVDPGDSRRAALKPCKINVVAAGMAI